MRLPQFTIRDMLWLTAVIAMGVVVWINQRTTEIERAALDKERRELIARRKSMDKEWSVFERVVLQTNPSRAQDVRTERVRFEAEQVPESEREQSKQRSIELGAPQPKPLPPGYGEKPNAPRDPAG